MRKRVVATCLSIPNPTWPIPGAELASGTASRPQLVYPVRMSQVTVIAVIRALPGNEAAVRTSLVQLVAPTRAEAGCLNYDLHVDIEDPNRFVFNENWESQEHLDRHLQTEHIAANRERIGNLIEGVEMKRFEPIDA